MPECVMRISAMVVMCLVLGVSCGDVHFGSTRSDTPNTTDDDYYNENYTHYNDYSRYYDGDYSSYYSNDTGEYYSSPYRVATHVFNSEQEGLYSDLSRELTLMLNAYRRFDAPGFSHVWPELDACRVRQLNVKYDHQTQLFSWAYENVGDYNLSGTVDTTDLNSLITYAVYSDYADEEYKAVRAWMDTDIDGVIGLANAREMARSYGRSVAGYRLLAGQAGDPAQMGMLSYIETGDRTPGWPPHYELHIANGAYRYLCIQPVAADKLPICSYVVDMLFAGMRDSVRVYDATNKERIPQPVK